MTNRRFDFWYCLSKLYMVKSKNRCQIFQTTDILLTVEKKVNHNLEYFGQLKKKLTAPQVNLHPWEDFSPNVTAPEEKVCK